MKKLSFLLFSIILSLIIGCSKSDKGTNGDGGGETFVPRVIADTTSAAPSTLNAEDANWDAIDSAIVEIGFSSEYGQNQAMIKDTLLMKVIRTTDMLYIWAKWHDQSADLWGRYSRKSGGVGLWEHITTADAGGGEDAFMIIFDTGDNGAEGADCATMCHAVPDKMATTGGGHVDAWCWKSAKIAPAHLAEDQWWTSAGDFLDPPAGFNPQQPYIENWTTIPAPGRPKWMHADDTAFHGLYLYVEDAIDFDGNPYIGWDSAVGYKMPGYLIDTSIYSMADRDDRWDVLAASSYDSTITSHTWTVVLARKLAPPSASDVDLRNLDSIQVTVAASNDHTYGSDVSFHEHSGSVPFYIVFRPPAE